MGGMEFSPNQWLEVFRSAGEALRKAVPQIAGRPDASVRLRRGAGGDQTFYIDDMAERIVIVALEGVARQGIGFTLISEECGIGRSGVKGHGVMIRRSGVTGVRSLIWWPLRHRFRLKISRGYCRC